MRFTSMKSDFPEEESGTEPQSCTEDSAGGRAELCFAASLHTLCTRRAGWLLHPFTGRTTGCRLPSSRLPWGLSVPPGFHSPCLDLRSAGSGPLGSERKLTPHGARGSASHPSQEARLVCSPKLSAWWAGVPYVLTEFHLPHQYEGLLHGFPARVWDGK